MSWGLLGLWEIPLRAIQRGDDMMLWESDNQTYVAEGNVFVVCDKAFDVRIGRATKRLLTRS